jgi:hypothetical protein
MARIKQQSSRAAEQQSSQARAAQGRCRQVQAGAGATPSVRQRPLPRTLGIGRGEWCVFARTLDGSSCS